MDCEVQTDTRCKDRAAEQSKKENANEWWASMYVKGTTSEVYIKRQKNSRIKFLGFFFVLSDNIITIPCDQVN